MQQVELIFVSTIINDIDINKDRFLFGNFIKESEPTQPRRGKE